MLRCKSGVKAVIGRHCRAGNDWNVTLNHENTCLSAKFTFCRTVGAQSNLGWTIAFLEPNHVQAKGLISSLDLTELDLLKVASEFYRRMLDYIYCFFSTRVIGLVNQEMSVSTLNFGGGAVVCVCVFVCDMFFWGIGWAGGTPHSALDRSDRRGGELTRNNFKICSRTPSTVFGIIILKSVHS